MSPEDQCLPPVDCLPRDPSSGMARRVLDGVERVLRLAMGVGLVTTVVAVTVQVIGRYLLRDIPVWTEETARYSSIWVAMLAMPVALRRRAHIAIDVLSRVPSPALQAAMRWLGLICTGMVLATLTVYGYVNLGPALRQISGGLGIPMAVVYAAVPAGSAISLVFLIESAFSTRARVS